MSEVGVSRRSTLGGKRVLVTRPAHQAAALSSRLRDLGAIPVELPVIEIVPMAASEINAALSGIDGYDWIVFTSVNTVELVADRIPARSTARIAAIGDATAAALAERHRTVDLVPGEFVAEAVVDALALTGIAGKRVLLPRADIARETLPDGLRAAGATVDVVPVYTTRLPSVVDDDVIKMLRSGEIDIVTFTSPSTVRNLVQLLGGRMPGELKIGCIGPITADAARALGLRVDVVAGEYTIPGLVQALVGSRDHE